MSARLESVTPPEVRPILTGPALLGKAIQRLNWREVMFRASAVLATSIFVLRASFAVAQNPGRITLILVVVTESLSAVLLLASHAPKTRDTHPVALLAVLWAYLYCAFVAVGPGINLLPPVVGTVIGCSGMLMSIWGKLSIGTSFGLLPAARKVVCSGPYRFVRHPIYVGYFMTHAAFLLSDFCLQNLMVLGALYLCQIVRVLREEAVLQQEPAYRAYCRNVPYRFCYRLI